MKSAVRSGLNGWRQRTYIVAFRHCDGDTDNGHLFHVIAAPADLRSSAVFAAGQGMMTTRERILGIL